MGEAAEYELGSETIRRREEPSMPQRLLEKRGTPQGYMTTTPISIL